MKQLEVLPRQLIGIVSPADSGKSALLVALLGQSIIETVFNHKSELRDYDIAYVPTVPSHIFSGMKSTLRGELELSSQLIGKLPKNIESIAHKFNITHLLDRDPFSLSGGEMVRSALAINAVTEPKIWLLDQIYDWLYPQSISDVRSLMLHEISIGHAVVEAHSFLPKWHKEFDVLVEHLDTKHSFKTKQSLTQSFNTHTETYISKRSEQNISPILQVENLEFQYPKNGFKIGPVNLNCYSGEIIALTGANGSGKTTLLQCLANLNQNFKGRLTVNNSCPSQKSWEWAKQAIYCFQNPDDQLYKATVLDEIKTTLIALKRAIPENLEEELISFGLADHLHSEPYHLARPIRRMVCFAASMISGSPVVLLDEPTANLDQNLKDIVHKKIHAPDKYCSVIIMVSHDMDFVLQSANQIIIMENGLIVDQSEIVMH